VVATVGGGNHEEVADVLEVTPRTVAFQQIPRHGKKLNIRTTAELIQFAIKSKILGSVKSAREIAIRLGDSTIRLNAAA